VTVANHKLVLGAAIDAAIAEARTFDLALLPWDGQTVSAQDMAQYMVFDAGVPVVLVPPSAAAGPVDHIAVAWDGSRVAARALCDALPLLSAGGRVSVVTVLGEKSLKGSGLAQTLAVALERRGYPAKAVDIALDGRTIASALQDAALSEGAQMMAMGGFGHSRLRDFILGGATQGVFGALRLPVLLSH
jgi:nucleotide-binding universal stress UspA family protein